MNEKLAKRISHLFDGIGNNLQNTDPEWVDIIANFSQIERTNYLVFSTNIVSDRKEFSNILTKYHIGKIQMTDMK